MQRREYLKASGAAAGLAAVAGCLGGGGGDSGPITIGAIEPLSGNFTPWGQSHRAGLEFAVQEVNEEGGPMGRDVELTVTDTQSDPTEADSVFRRFVEQEGAVAVTGPVSSDVGIRTASTAEDVEVPLFLHMSGSDEVLTPDTRHTFRVGLLPAGTTMRAISQLIADAGYESVGAVVADYAWGQSVRAGIEEHVGADVPVQVAPLGADDFTPFLRQLPEDVEVLIPTGHPPGTFTIVQQAYELGMEPEVIPGPSFPPGVIRGALGENVTRGFTHIHMTDVYSQEFADLASRFAEANDARMDTHAGYGYVTVRMLARAIEDAGSTDPTAIADAVRDIEFDTIFARPIQYTEYGELKDQVQLYSQFSLDAPSYYPDGSYSLVEAFRTDPLPPLPAGGGG